MCQYSLHIRKDRTREAVPGETLTCSLFGGRGNNAGHYCLKGKDGKVVCVKPDTKMVLGMLGKSQLGYGGDYRAKDFMERKKGRVAVTLQHFHPSYNYRGAAGDCIKTKDDVLIHLSWLPIGTKLTVYKPRVRTKKITGKAGMKAVEKAIVEATKVPVVVEKHKINS